MFWAWWNAQATYRQMIVGGLVGLVGGGLLGAVFLPAGLLVTGIAGMALLAGMIGAAVR